MKKIILFFTVLSCLVACTPDIDILAEPKDITVTYALINAGDSAQYFKIYKAFLTSGNAYEAASDLRNISYFDSIVVTLNQMNNGNVVRTITLDTTTAIPKDPGTFAYPKQVLYYTREPVNSGFPYELRIKNKYTDKEISAETQIVGPAVIQYPIEGGRFSLSANNATIRFSKSQNAMAYDLYLVFRYIEVSKQTGQIVRKGSIKSKLNSDLIRTTAETYSHRIIPSHMYELIKNQMSNDPTVTRYRDGYDCIEIHLWAAEKTLVTYMDVNKSSSSIIQDKNLYTNFESSDNSAFGIFSSRSTKAAFYDLSDISEDSLVKGSKTSDLGFDYYRNYPGKK